MTVVQLLVAILATWGISALLYYAHGPGDMFLKLRDWLQAHGPAFVADQLECFWCTALWVSIPVSVLAWVCLPLLLPLALFGASILLGGGGRLIWREMIDHE